MSKRLVHEIKSWVIVIAIVMVIRATFVEGMLIPTQSMQNTILIGDAILFNRFVYGVKIPYINRTLIPGRMPNPGNIVAFKSPLENKKLVKRCIANHGDTVQIINKAVYVNGRLRYEPYTQHTDHNIYQGTDWNFTVVDWWKNGELYKRINPAFIRDNFGPVIIPKDYIFVMGDNRDESFDCRFWGPLHKKYLLGKPLFIYMSIDLGGPRQTTLEILQFWKWKRIRPSRIGQLISS